jgi:hypothetical protein
MHVVFPPGPGKTAFLTTYEDFHSYKKEIDWTTLRATWGITGILRRRLHTATENLHQVQYFLTPILVVLTLLALAELLVRRDRRRLWLLFPALLFALLEYLFYTFIAAFSGPGSLIKSLATLLPFISMAIVGMFARYARSIVLVGIAVLLVAGYSAYQGYTTNLASTHYYNSAYAQYGVMKSIILKDAAKQGIAPGNVTVLTRDTWDVYEATGFKTVMVPNNDVNTIVAVAQHYHARYILLPAERPQLDKIYKNTTPDPRFHFVAQVPGTEIKIYWLAYPEGGS